MVWFDKQSGKWLCYGATCMCDTKEEAEEYDLEHPTPNRNDKEFYQELYDNARNGVSKSYYDKLYEVNHGKKAN